MHHYPLTVSLPAGSFNQVCCDRDVCAMWSEAVTCMLQIRIVRFCRATTAEKQQKHSSGLTLSDY